MSSAPELITPGDLLRNVRTRMFDFGHFGRLKVTEALGREPDCGAGCAFCCYPKVLIDGSQGALIAIYLNQTGRLTPALVKRLAEADAAMAPVSHAEWHARRIPCVFLTEKARGLGRCSVYPARPIACVATWGSRTGDPKDCGVVGGTAQMQVALHPDDMSNLVAYHEGILNGFGETKTWCMTIPGAVLYGLALLQGLPPPPVFRLAKEDMPEGESVETWFDGLAARAMNPPESPEGSSLTPEP